MVKVAGKYVQSSWLGCLGSRCVCWEGVPPFHLLKQTKRLWSCVKSSVFILRSNVYSHCMYNQHKQHSSAKRSSPHAYEHDKVSCYRPSIYWAFKTNVEELLPAGLTRVWDTLFVEVLQKHKEWPFLMCPSDILLLLFHKERKRGIRVQKTGYKCGNNFGLCNLFVHIHSKLIVPLLLSRKQFFVIPQTSS